MRIYGIFSLQLFRAHEYGHVNLGHLIRGTYPSQAEYEADCWAAQNAPLQQVQAAYEHFMNQGYMGNWSHGTGIQRATRLAQCNADINNQNNDQHILADSVFTSIERQYWEFFQLIHMRLRNLNMVVALSIKDRTQTVLVL